MTQIRAIALDIDGVLTDGCFVWGPAGTESKRFSFRDVMGISLAMRAGITFALVSGEDTPLVDRYAEKMRIVDVHRGCKDKASALRDFAESHGLPLECVCFVGDDVNDLPALAIAGFSAAPGDAHPRVKREVDYVAEAYGGKGAVREILDYLMDAQSVDGPA